MTDTLCGTCRRSDCPLDDRDATTCVEYLPPEDDMKHCLKCKHLYLSMGERGYSEMTPSSPANISCLKGQFDLDPDSYDAKKEWGDAAKKCTVYEEEK